MNDDTEKKEIIEKLIDEWLKVTSETSRLGLDRPEKEVRDILRAKAYEIYGITS